MAWEVEYTGEFESWWNDLTEEEQIELDAKVWYDEYVPIADRLFEDHLKQIKQEEKREKEQKSGKKFPRAS